MVEYRGKYWKVTKGNGGGKKENPQITLMSLVDQSEVHPLSSSLTLKCEKTENCACEFHDHKGILKMFQQLSLVDQDKVYKYIMEHKWL